MHLSLFGAFLGGMLMLLSPCSVMLLPAFFAYAFTSPGALLARTGVFFAGLATTLVPLGVLAGTLGAWVNQYRFDLVTIASIVVVVLGVIMMLGIPIPGLTRQRGAKSASIVSVFALGTVYGLAGVCAGPMLGAALTIAAFGGDPLFGGLVLLVFAIGMVVPLFLLALLWNRLPAVRNLVRPRTLAIGAWRNSWTSIIGGALTIAVGVLLLLTGGTTTLGGLLGATGQAQLEATIMRWSGSVSDWVFVLVIGIAVLLFVAARHYSQRTHSSAIGSRSVGDEPNGENG